ncbi:MAG: HPr family phosphocarrier protein [Aurantimonas endophytica]|uniref:Phosphocarrier protein n=1 Tax=Aurantimonas endophytica TaxID=1522175 RepID=A0A7W6HHG6_9HYPH|nr:HPr family phosphocarrier protein [Aurantimonas endophytica]MBB4005274.1 phosphocarrier protein [Aurantimonas endophytica]MCO6406064.1 HPr family phosphocarrier protein [Aurantimonas endophytica]
MSGTNDGSRCGKDAEGPEGRPNPDARILTIVNRRGLHARASARFVQTAETFDAELTISRDGLSVGGQSIMGLMMLAASQGCTIEVTATGTDATAALDAIEALVANRFGEEH